MSGPHNRQANRDGRGLQDDFPSERHGEGTAVGTAYVGIVANAAGFAEAAEPADIADAAVAVFAASLMFAAIGLAATGRFVFLGSKGRTA